MSLISGIHEKGSCSGIHACKMLTIDNLFDGQFAYVIPMLVIGVLSQKCNWSLGIIWIQLRHIKIVNKVYHSNFASRSVLFTSQLFEGCFQHILKICGVRVEVKVYFCKGVILWEFTGNLSDYVVCQLGFTRAGRADDQTGVLHCNESVNELFSGDGFSCWDCKLLHLVVLLSIEIYHFNFFRPFIKFYLVSCLIDIVVENRSFLREFDWGFPLAFPPPWKLFSIINSVFFSETSSDCPHQAKHKYVFDVFTVSSYKGF